MPKGGPPNPARETAKASGEKYYFTGKPCRNGHVAKRLVSCHKCVECDRERQLSRRQNDADFRAAASRRHKMWLENNREHALEQKAKWYTENRDRHLENSARWIRNNRDAVNTIRRRHYRKTQPKQVAYRKARIKKVKQATPKWADLREIQLFYEGCPEGHQVDHEIPINGKNVCGLHVIGNLQYLTIAENSAKRNHWPWDSDKWRRNSVTAQSPSHEASFTL